MAITQVQAAQLRRAITKRVAAELDQVAMDRISDVVPTMEVERVKRHCVNTREQLDDLIKRLTIYEVFRARKPSAKKAKP